MNCSIYAGVDTKTGRLVELRGDDAEGSVLCNRLGEKGERAIKFHYHPKRINHPLKGVGERGEDKWEQISYDQAIKEIAEKLQALIDEYGPETLVASEGTYRSDHLWARSRFTNLSWAIPATSSIRAPSAGAGTTRSTWPWSDGPSSP